MNKTVRTLSIISLCFCGVYLLLSCAIIALQGMYLWDGLKGNFYLPPLSASFSLLFTVIIIIANIILIVKQFNRSNCLIPVILTGAAYGAYSLCVKFFYAFDIQFIAFTQGPNGVAGIGSVDSYLTLFTSFPLTVMSVLAIVSAAINCCHCKTFKEELL